MSEKHQHGSKPIQSDGDPHPAKRHILRAPLAATHPVNSGSHSPLSLGKRAAVTSQQRFEMIASAAYLRATTHDVSPSCDLDNWLAAEKEIDLMLASCELPKSGDLS